MNRWRSALAAAALMVPITAGAVSFPDVVQPPVPAGGALQIMSGQSCTAPCEGAPFSVMASDTAALLTDCTGTCRVKLQCRAPGALHDVALADSGALTDAASLVPLTSACPWVVRQITTCTSGTCKVRAWVVQLHGTY